jgi:hypothetical protein
MIGACLLTLWVTNVKTETAPAMADAFYEVDPGKTPPLAPPEITYSDRGGVPMVTAHIRWNTAYVILDGLAQLDRWPHGYRAESNTLSEPDAFDPLPTPEPEPGTCFQGEPNPKPDRTELPVSQVVTYTQAYDRTKKEVASLLLFAPTAPPGAHGHQILLETPTGAAVAKSPEGYAENRAFTCFLDPKEMPNDDTFVSRSISFANHFDVPLAIRALHPNEKLPVHAAAYLAGVETPGATDVRVAGLNATQSGAGYGLINVYGNAVVSWTDEFSAQLRDAILIVIGTLVALAVTSLIEGLRPIADLLIEYGPYWPRKDP